MCSFQIEGLHEDVDFRAKVTRVELEEICSDLFERVSDPIRQALEAADMTMVCVRQEWCCNAFYIVLIISTLKMVRCITRLELQISLIDVHL